MTWPSHAEKHSGGGFKTNLRDNRRSCDWPSELVRSSKHGIDNIMLRLVTGHNREYSQLFWLKISHIKTFVEIQLISLRRKKE